MGHCELAIRHRAPVVPVAVVGADPSSLGVLAPPADYGADIVCGDIQPLGMHMQFGGGHAGCEAALAAARMGCSVLLMAIDLDKLAAMPCSPSIGGMAKGQLVKELDALGGEMAKITDKTAISFRTLNTKKGPAVHSSRTQNDKIRYHTAMKAVVEKQRLGVPLVVFSNFPGADGYGLDYDELVRQNLNRLDAAWRQR